MNQIELFSLNQIDDRDFYHGFHDHHMTEKSTRTKRPIKRAAIPAKDTAAQTSNVNTIQGT